MLLVMHVVVVSRHQQTPPLAVTSVINSPWSVAAKCIALGARSVHSTRWILAQNKSRFLLTPRAFDAPVTVTGFLSEYCHDVWYETN